MDDNGAQVRVMLQLRRTLVFHGTALVIYEGNGYKFTFHAPWQIDASRDTEWALR
jgi:hypothetical protein